MVIEEKKWERLGKENWNTKEIHGFFFELVVQDDDRGKVDRFTWRTIKDFRRVLELLRLKYGLNYK